MGFSARQASLQDDSNTHFHSDLSNYEPESEIRSVNDSNRQNESKVICPICGTETNLLKCGVLGLPINTVIENKIKERQNKLPHCELCTSTAFAFARCEQCDIFMCALCVDSHLKFWDTSHHRIIHLNAVKPSHPTYKCKAHPQQELNYFCGTCAKLMCFVCCTSSHSSHKYETVAKAADNYSSLIRQALETVKVIIKNSNHSLDAIKGLEVKIMSKCNDVEREIKGFIQAYKEVLDEHAQSLLQQLTSIKDSRKQLLISHKELLDRKVRSMQPAIEFAEELIKSTPVELLNTATHVLSKLDINDESDLQVLTMRVSDVVQFLPEEKATNIGKYQLFGIISTQVISPQHCTLEADGLLRCRQHKKATFKLLTKDNDNKPLCHGGEKIISTLQYKDEMQRLLPVFVNDEGDGSYTLSFKADTPGNLTLTVLIRNIHIQGSPFNVCVCSLRPHKGVYHCCAFCSSRGSKSAKCACGCKMPGGYEGCGHGHIGHPGRRHWSCCGNLLQNSECSRPITYQF
ncbi:tripartite motif-containing protein 45 isoform X2 [Cimex lectularius]|uniref:B box-type domain-containing protein n=1 Tax=Cimex lectularius TaxID=79782 RepID=A0A8I6SA24_CIMLE|nr:tripartite motif-containing protein 45 isoform X2 [Cimex lectularius]